MLKSQLVTTLLTQPQLFCVKEFKKINVLREPDLIVIHPLCK